MQNRVGVLAIAVVAVISIGGIYMYTRQPPPPQQAATPAPQPASPAPPAVQPTAPPQPVAAPTPQPAPAPAASTAAVFTCPKTGGDLVFGGEAKVNSLDMYGSNTISTRNNAMN